MRKLLENESDVEGWFVDWERFCNSHNSGRGLNASDSFRLFGQYLTGFRKGAHDLIIDQHDNKDKTYVAKHPKEVYEEVKKELLKSCELNDYQRAMFVQKLIESLELKSLRRASTGLPTLLRGGSSRQTGRELY